MGRTSGATLGLGIGAVETQAAGLDAVDTFGIGGAAITPLAPAAQDRFVGVTPGPGGGTYGPGGDTYAVGFVNVGATDNAMAVARVDTNGDLDPTFVATGSHR